MKSLPLTLIGMIMLSTTLTSVGWAESVEDFCNRPENNGISIATWGDAFSHPDDGVRKVDCKTAVRWVKRTRGFNVFVGNGAVSGDAVIYWPQSELNREERMVYIRENVTDSD